MRSPRRVPRAYIAAAKRPTAASSSRYVIVKSPLTSASEPGALRTISANASYTEERVI
jgi:hypothetical protein